MHFVKTWPCVALTALALFSSFTFALADRGHGDGDDDGDWPMYNHDPLGTRVNPSERKLGPSTVAGLRVLWSVPTNGVVAGTPAVVGDTVFVGDTSGAFYALDSRSGRVRWRTQIDGARITASPIVLRGRVVVGDQGNGSIYGLDQGNGQLRWKIRPNTTGKPAVWGSGTQVGGFVAIGIASNEETTDLPPGYVFRSRGSVLLLDPSDGRVIWQTFTISDHDFANGAAGVSIWATPAYDAESNMLFIGTGNNFIQPATNTSDAVMGLDARSGMVQWVNQRTPNDTWTPLFPTGPDFDFGDSPQLYRLPNGRKVVGIGQKSGFYHVFDPATGAVLNFRQFFPGSILGGLFSDSAVAGGMVFADGNVGTGNGLSVPKTSALIALTGDGSTELWRFPVNGVSVSGVAVANGVVDYKPASDPNLYAINAANGVALASVNVGQSNSGPSISRGRLFIGTGNILGGQAAGSIVALGIGDDDDDE
jgi:outer membrane protein assembly factor BamB